MEDTARVNAEWNKPLLSNGKTLCSVLTML